VATRRTAVDMKIKIFNKKVTDGDKLEALEADMNKLLASVDVIDVKISFTGQSVSICGQYRATEEGDLYFIAVVLYNEKIENREEL